MWTTTGNICKWYGISTSNSVFQQTLSFSFPKFQFCIENNSNTDYIDWTAV